MTGFTGLWRIVSPKTRKEMYTTVATDSYDPRATSLSPSTAVTWYSQVMRGPGSRHHMYKQYDAMDSDIDISRSLDIIAEEASIKDDKVDLPFIIKWQKEDNQDVSDSTIVTVRAALRQWTQLQDLNKRIFSTARCLIKYGDCFFRKSSDTRKWIYIDPSLIFGIEIDEHGEKVAYHLKKASVPNTYGNYRNDTIEIVPAAAMIHFTMSDDMGDSAPFGNSVLRAVFRVYKQLSMLEDAVIIYKIVRAPERRVFYIDVGNMNQQQVRRYLENIKNEIRQKKTPGTGISGNRDVVDGQYDLPSLQEDYFFPVTASGKGPRVETLPGGSEDFGTNLLRQFQEKIFRGLRIPTSYMSGGTQEGGGAQVNDGKVGIAYIEEVRFGKFVSRIQDRLNEIYDEEFKIYMKVCGLRVDDEVFSIMLPEPTNYTIYKQAALDADLISSFSNIQEVDFISKRFLLKRYLGLTDDELQMNEVMIKEERNLVDNAKVPIMQQIYDPSVYKNRQEVNMDDEDSQPGMGGGDDEFSNDPTAGLLGNTGFEDTPPANNDSPAPEEPTDTSPAPEISDKPPAADSK